MQGHLLLSSIRRNQRKKLLPSQLLVLPHLIQWQLPRALILRRATRYCLAKYMRSQHDSLIIDPLTRIWGEMLSIRVGQRPFVI